MSKKNSKTTSCDFRPRIEQMDQMTNEEREALLDEMRQEIERRKKLMQLPIDYAVYCSNFTQN